MPFEIPADLNPDLIALAWMIGSWEGNGHGTWPGLGEFEFGQRMEFATNGQGYLHYLSQLWRLDDRGCPDQALTMESGFWMPARDGTVEVTLAHPEGWSELWVGKIQGPQIQLITDVVVRSPLADLEYNAGQRLYGQVEGHLLWSFDRSTPQVSLQPYLWGRLTRVS